ncbi:MAG: hypothetical protein MJE12_13145 [Alphaproteobacteria bacterium]|nr:hypothetical protein [Alphaproteobacteria bacterium]
MTHYSHSTVANDQNIISDLSIKFISRAALIFLVCSPLLYWFFAAYLEPRPYWIQLIHGDADSTYYYNAKLFSDGQAINSVFHPGVTANYIGYLVLKIAGGGIEKTQEHLNYIYLFLSLINSAALLFFTVVSVRKFGIGAAVFVLCVVVSWPSFLPYMNSFSPDSLTFVFSLPIAVLLWGILRDREPKIGALYLTGVVVGAALANKFNFIPVAAAVFLACSLSSFLNTRKFITAFANLIVILAGAGTGFLILMIPMLPRLPDVVIGTIIGRPTSQVSLDASTAAMQLFHASPVLFVVLLGLLMSCIVIMFSEYWKKRKIEAEPLTIILLFCVFYLSMASTVLTEQETAFRNVAPAAIVFPLAAFYIFDRRRDAIKKSSVKWALLLIGILCVSTTIALHIDRRSQMIEQVTTAKANVDSFVRENFPPNSIKIFWDGSSGDGNWGAAAFHFWSNYAYGAEQYDQPLLSRYPSYSWLRLRHIRDGALSKREKSSSLPRTTMQQAFSTLSAYWHRLFPRPYERKDLDRLFVGEGLVQGPAHILMPVLEFEREIQKSGISMADFLAFVRGRYPDASLKVITIDNVEWFAIDLTITGKSPR